MIRLEYTENNLFWYNIFFLFLTSDLRLVLLCLWEGEDCKVGAAVEGAGEVVGQEEEEEEEENDERME